MQANEWDDAKLREIVAELERAVECVEAFQALVERAAEENPQLLAKAQKALAAKRTSPGADVIPLARPDRRASYP